MVHVSGSAGAEELKLVLSIVQPKHFVRYMASPLTFVPMRASPRRRASPLAISSCARTAIRCSFPSRAFVLATRWESGIVYVDGLSVGDTSKDVLEERQALSNYGFATIAAAVNARKKQIEGVVRVEMRGITGGTLRNCAARQPTR